jgi:Peroxidase
MKLGRIIPVLIIAFVVVQTPPFYVDAGLIKCRFRNGPIPFKFRCDKYPNEGSKEGLDNKDTDSLNTIVNLETPEMTADRLGNTTRQLKGGNGFYNPVYDAYCFNEDYPLPSNMTTMEKQTALYADYMVIFQQIIDNDSDIAEGITRNRMPGMFLRMCFHDNAVNSSAVDFQTYVQNAIDPKTKKWTAESRYMITTGADASNLICSEEREHPNNDLDQTATRILSNIQRSLKQKHHQISYADLLHNGCNAAAIFLTGADPIASLQTNPFTFGRKDACHVDVKCSKRYALCGPTEFLPGVNLDINNVTSWFTTRGMNECLFMALMWTHTAIEPMGLLCPLQKLTCTASSDDVSLYGEDNRYFQVGDELDYFNFFLDRGTQMVVAKKDDDDAGCKWVVDGKDVSWPMTRIDCTLGISNVEANINGGTTSALVNVIKNFAHNASTYNRYDILRCALNVLGGTGIGG